MVVEKDRKKVRATWDDRARAAHVQFVKGKVAKTKEVAPGLIADISASGRLLGLELLNPENISPEIFQSVMKRFKAGGVSFNPSAIPDLFLVEA